MPEHLPEIAQPESGSQDLNPDPKPVLLTPNSATCVHFGATARTIEKSLPVWILPLQGVSVESRESSAQLYNRCHFAFVCVCSCSRKFHGYNSLKEYYEEESCMRYLHRVSGGPTSESVSLQPALPKIRFLSSLGGRGARI